MSSRLKPGGENLSAGFDFFVLIFHLWPFFFFLSWKSQAHRFLCALAVTTWQPDTSAFLINSSGFCSTVEHDDPDRVSDSHI